MLSDAEGQYGYLVVEPAEAQAAQDIPSEKGTQYRYAQRKNDYSVRLKVSSVTTVLILRRVLVLTCWGVLVCVRVGVSVHATS